MGRMASSVASEQCGAPVAPHDGSEPTRTHLLITN